MDLTITSRNNKLSEKQRDYIEEKLGKLMRYDDQLGSAKVEISTEQRTSQGEVHRVQVTLVGEHGVILRAEQAAADLREATDRVQDVLQRQVTRYKDKRERKRRKADQVETAAVPVAVGAAEEDDGQIVRVKEFALKPMFSEEAIEQMDLLGHTFFVFRDAQNSRVSVVYRRRDGQYGMIVPIED